MNFLRKILLIAVVAVFTGNTEGMAHSVFDLPDDTPGLLLHDRPNKNVCGKQKACVHVVIGNDRTYELVRNINDNNGEVGFDSIADNYQVYFPADGTQPTTEKAREYSCANIDNTPNSPITEWYMQMFGLNPLSDGSYVKAGYHDSELIANKIVDIDFNAIVTVLTKELRNFFELCAKYNMPEPRLLNFGEARLDEKIGEADIKNQPCEAIEKFKEDLLLASQSYLQQLNDHEGLKKSYNSIIKSLDVLIKLRESFKRQLNNQSQKTIRTLVDTILNNFFIDNFRKIASNPVGRVLLYRILIEIRRRNVIDQGVCENNVNIKVLRNIGCDFQTLMLTVPDFFKMRNQSRNLLIRWDYEKFAFVNKRMILFNNCVRNLQFVNGRLEDTNLVSIHLQKDNVTTALFHELLHWYHWLRDPDRLAKETTAPLAINEGIGGEYYAWLSSATPEAKRLASVAWFSSETYVVDLEEIRTILGSNERVLHYLEGDDLSENVFILSIQYPRMQIRFGHCDFPYIEHLDSVKCALNFAYLSLLKHMPHINYPPLNVPRIRIVSLPKQKMEEIEGHAGTRYPKTVNEVNFADIAKKIKS